jgi:hypothetical protein
MVGSRELERTQKNAVALKNSITAAFACEERRTGRVRTTAWRPEAVARAHAANAAALDVRPTIATLLLSDERGTGGALLRFHKLRTDPACCWAADAWISSWLLHKRPTSPLDPF